MGGLSGVEERDYVSLRDVKVELWRGLGGDDNVDEGNGVLFTLCFWLYIDKCATLPTLILVQKHPDVISSVPFLWLDNEKKMKIFPLLFLHEEAPSLDNSIPWTKVPFVSTEIEFPIKKWVHVGCEVLKDLVRLHVDGEIEGEMPLTCSINKEFHAEAFKKLYLEYLDENDDIFHGYVHGLDLLFPSAVVKNHYVKDPPVRLSIDQSSVSEIEDDGDGVWSIVGGKPSCRKSFSLDVMLLDVFDCAVNKELEVVASLLYAYGEAPVENTSDSEPPLLTSCGGIEYASRDRPCKLINGRAAFKLKISQLSSKCYDNLFRIKFDVPKLGKFPFLETLSPPIHCVSRHKNIRTACQTCKKSSERMNGCDSPGVGNHRMEIIPNIVREAKPSPSSKRIKLGNDVPFAMSKEDAKFANKENGSCAWTSNEDNTNGVSMIRISENNSFASDNSKATNTDPKSISSPISDTIIFKYCLGGQAERCNLLKELAFSASEEQLANFSEQVSLYSGCSHHRQQIRITKRLVEEGIQAWSSISENNNHVLWENLVIRINALFMKIACSARSLMNQDFECLRRLASCRDLVSQDDFERLWSWLYPVAFTLSQSAVNSTWNSISPVWIEGFITKEEAEASLHGPRGLLEPGTFVLRFPTSRSWPHPDAGNPVVTYVGGDHKIHHRLLSLDFVYSISSKESTVESLLEMLLQEPELSRLGKVMRSH